MGNIFENAYFGKPYKTRDERKVIYCGTFENNSLFNTKVVINTDVDQASDYIDFRWYTQEGKSSIADSPADIVSEWEEGISEEELNELAEKSFEKEVRIANQCEALGICHGFDYQSGFKNGYREMLKKLNHLKNE